MPVLLLALVLPAATCGCNRERRSASNLSEADTIVYAKRRKSDGYFEGYVFEGGADVDQVVAAVRDDLKRRGPGRGTYLLSVNHLLLFVDSTAKRVVAMCEIEGDHWLSLDNARRHAASSTIGTLSRMISTGAHGPVTLETLSRKMPFVVPHVWPDEWRDVKTRD